MKTKSFLKKQKGVMVTDAIIAIIIILLFTGVITSLIVNIVLESSRIKVNSQQMEFATEILEYVEKISYEEATTENIITYINGINPTYLSAGTSTDSLTTQCKIAVQVETYDPTADSTGLDLIKTITLSIKNDLEDNSYTTEMSTLKKRTVEEVAELLEE